MNTSPTPTTLAEQNLEERFNRDWVQSKRFAVANTQQAVIVYGPHACGKTTRAVELARYFGKTIIIDNERYRDYPDGFPPQALVLSAARLPGAIHFDDVVYSMWRFSQAEPPVLPES